MCVTTPALSSTIHASSEAAKIDSHDAPLLVSSRRSRFMRCAEYRISSDKRVSSVPTRCRRVSSASRPSTLAARSVRRRSAMEIRRERNSKASIANAAARLNPPIAAIHRRRCRSISPKAPSQESAASTSAAKPSASAAKMTRRVLKRRDAGRADIRGCSRIATSPTPR